MTTTSIAALRAADAFPEGRSSLKTCCVLYPAFSDEIDLANNLYRAVWYLAGLLKDDGLLIVPQVVQVEGELPIPRHLDPGIESVFQALRSRIVGCGPDELLEIVQSHRAGAHVLLCHKEEARRELVQLAKKLPQSRVVRVDPEATQYESSFYLKLTSNDGAGTAADVHACRERFRAMTAELDGDRVFIFGTGPSLDGVDFGALPSGEKIVTNSMVVNAAMMETIRPRVIVASDPIFHAGCSSYAGEFRGHLIRAMREYGSYFVFPMRDYGVYKTHMPEDLQERLIGIPLVGSVNLNQRLQKSFHVSTTQNVMTLFLLPIATSVSKNVVLAGFDGRPISESSYFWSHSKGAQLHHRMEEIQAAHPAFFKISYNEYLFRHMRCVANYLDEAEAAGVRITSITDSHVPAIKGRFVEGDLGTALAEERPQVSIVMPCFNVAESIETSLASIFGQSLADWELVCIDDGSTDKTWEILNRYAVMDERIVPVRQENAGVSGARNAALARARGEFVCFLDADDLMLPGSLLTRYLKAKEAGPDEIVFGTTVMQDGKGNDLNLSAGGGDQNTLTFDQFAKWPAALQTGFGRAHLFKAARFRADIAYCEDWLYFAEIARTGVRLVNCRKNLSAYRWHKDAATQRNFKKAIVDTSTVFSILTSDDWENGMLQPEYAVGLDPAVFHQIELKRMYGMLLMSIFRREAGELSEILDFIERKARLRPLEKFLVDDVERAAVRTFFKPFQSRALYQHLEPQLSGYRDFVAAHVDAGKHGVFVDAFRAFAKRAEKAVGASTKPKSPALADAAGSASAANTQAFAGTVSSGSLALKAAAPAKSASASATPSAVAGAPDPVTDTTTRQTWRKAVCRKLKRFPLFGPAIVAARERRQAKHLAKTSHATVRV